MFHDVKSMTTEDIQKELDAIKEYERVISDVTVESLLKSELNLDFLKDLNCTITPNKQLFRSDKLGFLPEMLEGMYNDRKKYKKLMLKAEQEYENETDKSKKDELSKLISRYYNLQLAKKVSLNSAYGAMGSVYFRFFDLRLALAVTTSGQLSIRWIENKINSYMNRLLKTDSDYVIASDTDSIYLRLEELVKASGCEDLGVQEKISFMDKVCNTKIQPYIDQSYQELADYVNAFAQKMRMKREGLCDKGFWTAKKRYVLNVYNNEGVQYNEPHLKVMGLEVVKSSTPVVVRDNMKKLIKLIVTGTEKEVQDFIKEFRAVFKTLPPEDISFPRGVNNLKQYRDSATLYKKGTPINVKGSLLYNDYLVKGNLDKKYPLIQEGEKIKYTYLKLPNPLRSPVIAFPGRLPVEFGLNDYIDHNTQFEKTFLEPISVLLDCVNWKSEKVNTLESFFGD